MPKVIVQYLQKLELELKKIPGISPEEALCDAREFLLNDYAASQRSGEPLDDSSYSSHIVETFGTPEVVAAQYAPAAMASQHRIFRPKGMHLVGEFAAPNVAGVLR